MEYRGESNQAASGRCSKALPTVETEPVRNNCSSGPFGAPADDENATTTLTNGTTPSTEHHIVTSSINNHAMFDLACIRDAFAAALDPSTGQILLEPYIAGYREVLRFVQALGTLFNFVGKDLDEKLCVLEDRRASPDAKHYQTVEDMMVFEISQGLKTWKKRESGSRVLLVLHRALQFLNGFIEGVPSVPDGGKLSTLASEVYARTLAHHHAYLVKKAVGVAVYTVSTFQH